MCLLAWVLSGCLWSARHSGPSWDIGSFGSLCGAGSAPVGADQAVHCLHHLPSEVAGAVMPFDFSLVLVELTL